MAKLYLKLFPKLVSSLAVLLLCQFGYVACQPTGFSDSRLPADEGTHDILSIYIYILFLLYTKEGRKFVYLLNMSFSFNIF
jgi:hypothetical protein